MFEPLLWGTIAIIVAAMIFAYDGSRDIFHPLVFLGPMFIFLYGWMPIRLLHKGDLDLFFDREQLAFIGTLNLLGVGAFLIGCLLIGTRHIRNPVLSWKFSDLTSARLVQGGTVVGCIGLGAWLIQIVNVGGVVNAFSRPYSGGWDDSGYVRDTAILLLGAILLLLAAITKSPRPRPLYWLLLVTFISPWLLQAILTSRRGPTFALAIVLSMGWYLNQNRRPLAIAAVAGGVLLGCLTLFLVVNRSHIYIGSDFEFTTDVSTIVEAPDTGNEYIYGSGSVLSAQRRGHYFWLRRYLAQIVVRPFPSALWPTKYEDFGVPELLHNAGTGEGFGDVMGWEGAVGSAPGIVADLWIEACWLAPVLMFLLGMLYGWLWKKAILQGGVWAGQYAIFAALSMYLVMQTMEAVIFRTLLLSIPLWAAWKWALAPLKRVPNQGVSLVRYVRT